MFYGRNCFRVQMTGCPWSSDSAFWKSTAQACITGLPEVAFACQSKVSLRLELCTYMNATYPRFYLDVKLCHNGLPAVLISREQPRGFCDIIAKLQALVDKINQKIGRHRHSGVCKKDVVDVITVLKADVHGRRHRLYTQARSCEIILG